MKIALIAAASIVGIIVVRMILSVTFNEQTAEVFSSIAITSLFLYSILSFRKGKLNSAD